MSSIKNKIAKSNLIKSLSIGGGITAVITGLGLAISIPVYQSIQKQLGQKTSQVADLSRFMHELTAKLGIPAGQKFEKELANGYTFVYSNGKTLIYSGSGDEKSLIMNLNKDGSVGTAAEFQGPAAQQMLGVIEEAKSTIGSEVESMNDIMQDYKDQAVATSLATESAITGLSKELIVARNALSINGTLSVSEKAKALADAAKEAGVNLNQVKAQEKIAKNLIKERNKRKAEEEAARKKGPEALKKLRNKEASKNKIKALKYLNAKKHPTKNVTFNNINYPDISQNTSALFSYYQDMKIKDAHNVIALAKRTIAIKWLTSKKISYKNIKFTDKVGEGEGALEKTYSDLSDGSHDKTLQNFYTYQVTKIAQEKSDDHQVEAATSSTSSSSILEKIASNILSWPTMYVKAKYGYVKTNGSKVNPSKHLEKGLKSLILKQGVSEKNYKLIINYINSIIKLDSQGKPTKTFKFTQLVNTYNDKEVALSRLLVLRADISNLDGTGLESKYIVARTSKLSAHDLEKIHLSGSILESNTIFYLSKLFNANISKDWNNKSLTSLINYAESGNIKSIANSSSFEELMKIYKNSISANSVNTKKDFLDAIFQNLLKRYLFKGQNVKLKAELIIKSLDSFIDLSKANLSKTSQNINNIYSYTKTSWLVAFYKYITNNSILDTTKITNLSKNVKAYKNFNWAIKEKIETNLNQMIRMIKVMVENNKSYQEFIKPITLTNTNYGKGNKAEDKYVAQLLFNYFLSDLLEEKSGSNKSYKEFNKGDKDKIIKAAEGVIKADNFKIKSDPSNLSKNMNVWMKKLSDELLISMPTDLKNYDKFYENIKYYYSLSPNTRYFVETNKTYVNSLWTYFVLWDYFVKNPKDIEKFIVNLSQKAHMLEDNANVYLYQYFKDNQKDNITKYSRDIYRLLHHFVLHDEIKQKSFKKIIDYTVQEVTSNLMSITASTFLNVLKNISVPWFNWNNMLQQNQIGDNPPGLYRYEWMNSGQWLSKQIKKL